MEDIARWAGLAVGTLYNYFPSKDDLLVAIMRRDSERVVAIAERIVADAPADPVEAIVALADAFIETIAPDERLLWREVFAASIAAPATLGARLFALDARMLELFAAMVEKLKARSALAFDTDSSRAAGLFYGVCFTWSLAFVTSDTLTFDAMRAEVSQSIAMAVRGMLPSSWENQS